MPPRQRRLDSLPEQSGNVDTGGDSLVSIALEEEIAALFAQQGRTSD